MSNRFNPMKARVRATYASGVTNEPRLGAVDRETRTLHDVQITLEGEAKGHKVWLDRKFCEDVAAAGNAAGDAGVKVRFGHPAMCSDALGTYLGRAKNFRVVDVTRKESGEPAAGVVADVELDEHADRTAWVLDMSESAPDTFGQSIVFTYADYKVRDADGVEHSRNAECVDGVEDPDSKTGKVITKTFAEWMSQSADGKVYAVLGKLLGTDFTDAPAATDGVFSDTSLAAEAEQMLDEHPQILEVVERNPDSVRQFLTRVGLLERMGLVAAGVDMVPRAEADARVSGMQAAMQRQINDLRVQMDAKEQELATAKAETTRLTDALNAANMKAQELADQVTSLTDERDAAKNALDTLNGRVNHVNAAPKPTWTDARKHLASLPMAERAAFYAAHRAEIDNHIKE